MKLTLKIWRQPSTDAAGKFETHEVTDAKSEMTLLELLDRLNDALVAQGTEPIAFESDCREGICGTCGITVNGRPHGPVPNTTTCQQHVRSFKDGQTVQLEPFRSAAYPVVRDLIVDRSALDRVIEAGGFVSVDAGTAPDADTCKSRMTWPRPRWTSRPASAAVPAWRRARTGRAICSPAPSSPIWRCCRPGNKNASAGLSRWARRQTKNSGIARCSANAHKYVRQRSRSPPSLR